MKKIEQFNQNGFLVIKIPLKIRNKINTDISKILSNKISKVVSKNKKKKLSNILKKISKISDEKFLEFFGHSASRVLSHDTTEKINNWIKQFLPKILNKEVSLHYIADYEFKKNKSLKKRQLHANFRVVRPFKKDVTYPHRDFDFGKIYNKYFKAPIYAKDRLKIWIPIFGCQKSNSLWFYKKSHLKKNIKVGYIYKNQRPKPIISKKFLQKINKSKINPIKNFNNSAVMFHDKLIHFAPQNQTKEIRVSSEFTVVTN